MASLVSHTFINEGRELMAIKKFEDINTNEIKQLKKEEKKKKKIKLTKEEKIKIKEEKIVKKKELKEMKIENKKVLGTTKELLEFIDVADDESFIMKNGYLDIFQIESKDIYSFSETETKMHIYNFISFLRNYIEDFKIISMNFPVNTVKQQQYIKSKIKDCENEVYFKFLNEKLDELIFLDEHRQNREFYIMIFANEKSNKEDVTRSLLRNQNIAIQFKSLDIEKKLKILFKMNNPNTKLMQRCLNREK